MSEERNKKAVWFITGCSSGFGQATARHLLEAGYRVAVTARDETNVAPFASKYGSSALPISLDIREPSRIEAAVKTAVDHFGRIDCLLNNAGYGYLAAVEEGEEPEVRAMFETNFFGLVRLTQAVLPLMRAQQAGHIINITSTMGLMSRPGVGFYSASKFAVEGLSEALWREVSPLGIRVTCVEPGAYATDGPGRSLRVRSRAIDAYAKTAGPVIDATAGSSGSATLPAPILAAEAIQAVFESSSPPTNLVLTRRGLDMLREKLAHLATTSDAWEAVSVAAGT